MRGELDRFLLGEAHPSVRIVAAEGLVCCELQLLPAATSAPPTIELLEGHASPEGRAALRQLRAQLSEKFSQWAYVDRSLRVFGEDTVQLFKSPRLMDWTRTQALNDADAIIAEILAGGETPA